MKNTTLTSRSIFLVAGFLVACGGGGSAINSGVDANKPANELSDDEIEQVCEAIVDYADKKVDQKEISCKGTALITGILAAGGGDEAMQKACSDAYETCLDADPETPAEETNCADPDASVAVEDCDATVGEIESCLADRIDGAAAAADKLPACSKLTLDSLEDLEGTVEAPEEPESCKSLPDTCPDFGSSSSEG